MAYSSSPSAPAANATRAPTTVDRVTARSARPDVAPLVVTTAGLDLAGGTPERVALEPGEVVWGAPADTTAEVDPSLELEVELAEELVLGGLPEGAEDDEGGFETELGEGDGGGFETELGEDDGGGTEAGLEGDEEGAFDGGTELVLVGGVEEEKGNGTRTPPTGPEAGDDDDVPAAAAW
jgi:hypothetical protein